LSRARRPSSRGGLRFNGSVQRAAASRTGICLVTERDPIQTAKAVATFDVLSGGRFTFGIGAGWSREELANHGTQFESRWELLRERVEAMQAIWTQDVAEYHGTLVSFGPIWSWPKPIQAPHPPILLGGNGPQTLRRVVRYADGWVPIWGASDGDAIMRGLGELRRLAAEAGRQTPSVTVFFPPRTDAEIARLEAEGVTRLVYPLPSGIEDDVLPRIERLATIAEARR
jgi:probable F420-dependent oxidoreductase